MKFLTIDQAAKIVPLSKTTLYRVATRGDGPFWKREGRWLTTEPELVDWVKSGERGPIRGSADPMPKPRHTNQRRGATLEEQVSQLRKAA